MSDADAQTAEVEEKDAEAQNESPDTVDVALDTPRIRKSYGISKVQIRPGIPVKFDTGYDEPINYITSLPELPEDSEGYTPMTYTFRIPKHNNRKKIKNLQAKAPPFHVQIDHTLAVLWIIFSDGEYSAPCGISQLQWAFSFLKTIRKRDGTIPEDVKLATGIIQELLLDNYAELAKEIEKLDAIDKRTKYYDAFASTSVISKRIPFSMNYVEMRRKAANIIEEAKTNKQPELSEDELKAKIDQLIEQMEDFEHLEVPEKEHLVQDFVKYKEQIQKRCTEQMETLLAIQDVMKEVNPELFPEDENVCDES